MGLYPRTTIQARKFLHAGDFCNMVETNIRDINEMKTKTLADKIRQGGGIAISTLIEDIKAGRSIQI